VFSVLLFNGFKDTGLKMLRASGRVQIDYAFKEYPLWVEQMQKWWVIIASYADTLISS